MKLYTKTVCPKCIHVKSEMARLGVEVEVVNIDHDAAAREKLIEAGIMAAPVLEVNGAFHVTPGEIIAVLEEAAQ